MSVDQWMFSRPLDMSRTESLVNEQLTECGLSWVVGYDPLPSGVFSGESHLSRPVSRLLCPLLLMTSLVLGDIGASAAFTAETVIDQGIVAFVLSTVTRSTAQTKQLMLA